jgi:putative ABC transport system permease protein
MRRRPDPNITPPSVFRRRDALAEAFAVIAQRPVRTLLTALGTILGVGAFVTTTGLAQTASAQVSSRFDALRATEVRVQDAAPDGSNPFPADTDQRLQGLNGVNHAGVFYTVADPGTIQPRTLATRPLRTTTPIAVIAASPGALRAALPTLATGRLYDDWHQQRAEHVAVIGRVAADQLGIAGIDRQPVVFLDDTPYVIAGIIDDVARNPDLLLAITIPTTAADSQFAATDAKREVLIDTAPGAAQLIGAQAPLALRSQQPDRFQALVPPDPRTLRNQVENDVQTLFYALAGLALLVGAIAITNATLLNVVERRPEIGLRRALGATRHHITRQIALEASITGAIAGTIGAIIGLIAVVGVAFTRTWTPTINPAVLLAAPAIGTITGALAGIAPAIKAARTPPADTLRG